MDTRQWTKRVKEYMKMHRMAETGDGILAAVSGGADSVCLLLVLKELEAELGIRLAAFHLNHGLRGEEADRDEAYVRELCERLNVPLVVVREDVRAASSEHGWSEEEAGRILRYRHLEQAAKEMDCQRIATAHHRDDQAETVLMNLFRGSGLKGLGGIRPVRGTIIRPLLEVSRQEIEAYLYKKEVTWCEDSTNGEIVYERNKIRNVLLPWLEEEINEQAAAHILKTASFASQADAYFVSQAETILEAFSVQERAFIRIPVHILDEQPDILRSYVIRAMIRRIADSEKDISARHVDAIGRLTGPGGGVEADLPYGLKAVRGYEYLEICKKTADEEGVLRSEKDRTAAVRIETRTFEWKNEMEIPKNECTKWFDYDTIESRLVVRTREIGDYFGIGGGKRKLLKRFFIDEKIPEALRDEILLLADGNHILWIFGYRISEDCKITDKTRRILEVRVHKGEHYGREN